MKPARFILNSDYTTVRHTGETKLSFTIPNSFTVPADTVTYTLGQVTADIGNPTDTFMVFFTSSAFPYSTYGRFGGTKPDGASTTSATGDTVDFEVEINGNTATLEVWCSGNAYTTADWTGYGQTITAHILTFKDPFSE